VATTFIMPDVREPYILNRQRVPSVTESLNFVGARKLVGYNESQAIWRGVIGTAVHRATAFIDINHISWKQIPPDVRDPWDSLSPEVGDFCWCYEEFKRRERFVPRRVEHRLIGKLGDLPFGMTLDREGLLAGIPIILDLKTPKKEEPWWGVQLAGYDIGMRYIYKMPAERPYRWKRFALRLLPGAAVPYRLIPFTKQMDYDVFTWALGLTTWCRNNYPNQQQP
jgi:hypothetical protein